MCPATTLGTLWFKRGLVEILEEPAEFHVSRHQTAAFTVRLPVQRRSSSIATIERSVARAKFAGICCTGLQAREDGGVSGGMRASSSRALGHLLVPEIGLTPAVAADLHQVFATGWILHSRSPIRRGLSSGIASTGRARMVVGTHKYTPPSPTLPDQSWMKNRTLPTSRKKHRAIRPAT